MLNYAGIITVGYIFQTMVQLDTACANSIIRDIS